MSSDGKSIWQSAKGRNLSVVTARCLRFICDCLPRLRVIRANDATAGSGGRGVDCSKDVDRCSTTNCFKILTGR
jgi:hypothetical protein